MSLTIALIWLFLATVNHIWYIKDGLIKGIISKHEVSRILNPDFIYKIFVFVSVAIAPLISFIIFRTWVRNINIKLKRRKRYLRLKNIRSMEQKINSILKDNL